MILPLLLAVLPQTATQTTGAPSSQAQSPLPEVILYPQGVEAPVQPSGTSGAAVPPTRAAKDRRCPRKENPATSGSRPLERLRTADQHRCFLCPANRTVHRYT